MHVLIFNMLLRKSFLLLLSSWGSIFAALPTLHVCTYANHENQGLQQLQHSCRENHIALHVFGMGEYPFQFVNKIVGTREFLKNFPDDDVVLFVDAFDVIFTAGPDEILKRFLSQKVAFMIAAEAGCYPFKWLKNRYPQSQSHLSKFHYINSGAYIGYVGFIKNILDKLLEEFSELKKHCLLKNFNSGCCDQGLFTRYFFKHPEQIYVDHDCSLFICTHSVRFEELAVDVVNRSVCYLPTGQFPCIIHANGTANKPGLEKLFKALYLGESL